MAARTSRTIVSPGSENRFQLILNSHVPSPTPALAPRPNAHARPGNPALHKESAPDRALQPGRGLGRRLSTQVMSSALHARPMLCLHVDNCREAGGGMTVGMSWSGDKRGWREKRRRAEIWRGPAKRDNAMDRGSTVRSPHQAGRSGMPLDESRAASGRRLDAARWRQVA